MSGDAYSTLSDCTVYGNAFGAGYSATAPTVEVMPIQGFNPEPLYNENSGTYSLGGFPETVTYTWKHTDNALSDGDQPFEDDALGKHYILTRVDMNNLGKVTGNTEIKILGRTKVFGNIYGGGNMGEVGGNTKVIVNQNGN